MISRRTLLNTAGATAVLAGVPLFRVHAEDAPIKLGCIEDNSGVLDIYGKPIVMANALAVEEINAAGGLLGRKIELKQYDSQSDIALYTKYAQQLVREDKVDAAHAGITSASREAIRQTFRRGNTLYFYNMLYEGGVCDRNCFVTGTTPAQAVEPIIDYAMKKWGNKVYMLAADYNYGQITAKWVAHYVEQRKGNILATNFFPLDVSDFGSTIAKIQEADAELRRRRAGRRRPHVVLPAMGGVGHEQEDPADLDHLRRRQRASGAVAGRRRRHPDRRQLQPRARYARQQEVPGGVGQEVRRHQGRARDGGVAIPGHHAVGRSACAKPARSTATR